MAGPGFDVLIEGQALNSFGLTAFDTIEGLGLNTFGFLWPTTGIWTDCAACNDNVTTTWVEDCCGESVTSPEYLEMESGDIITTENNDRLIVE